MDQDKLHIMLELERRGALPEDKLAIVQELRARGVLASQKDYQKGVADARDPSILPFSASGAPELYKQPDNPVNQFAAAAGNALVSNPQSPQSLAGKAGAIVGNPVTLATGIGAALSGGASIPAQLGASALAGGAGEAYRQLAARAAGNKAPETPGAALGPIAKTASINAAITGLFSGAGKLWDMVQPQMAKTYAGYLQAAPGIKEKHGLPIANDPSILLKKETVDAAGAAYKAVLGDHGGLNDYLYKNEGKLLADTPTATTLVTDSIKQLRDKAAEPLPIDRAIAARQANQFLLNAAKYGNPELKANMATLVQTKNELDNYLEQGLPGFKAASKNYFEANAREAFSTLLPRNKNMSVNALRSFTALSEIASSVLLATPHLAMLAAPVSPLVNKAALLGAYGAFKAVSSPAGQFATRTAILRGLDNGKK